MLYQTNSKFYYGNHIWPNRHAKKLNIVQDSETLTAYIDQAFDLVFEEYVDCSM